MTPDADPNQDASPHYHDVQRHPHTGNYAPQAYQVPPPVPANGQPQDPYHVDMAYQGTIGYNPQMLSTTPCHPGAYVFPDAGRAQGRVPIQGQPVNQTYGFMDFRQNIAPYPPQAAFSQTEPHMQIPTPDDLRAENLRRVAGQYLDHHSSRVRTVFTEEGGTNDDFKKLVVIVIEVPNVS